MLCSVGTALTLMVMRLGVLSLRERCMRENCTCSLSSGRRLARKRASSDPSEPRFSAPPNRLGHESLDVTLAYLKGRTPSWKKPRSMRTGAAPALYAQRVRKSRVQVREITTSNIVLRLQIRQFHFERVGPCARDFFAVASSGRLGSASFQIVRNSSYRCLAVASSPLASAARAIP